MIRERNDPDDLLATDRWLDAATEGGDAGDDPLAALLSVAVGPAQPDELRGREEFVRAATSHQATAAEEDPGRSWISRVLAAKVALVAAIAGAGLVGVGAAGAILHSVTSPQDDPATTTSTVVDVSEPMAPVDHLTRDGGIRPGSPAAERPIREPDEPVSAGGPSCPGPGGAASTASGCDPAAGEPSPPPTTAPTTPGPGPGAAPGPGPAPGAGSPAPPGTPGAGGPGQGVDGRERAAQRRGGAQGAQQGASDSNAGGAPRNGEPGAGRGAAPGQNGAGGPSDRGRSQRNANAADGPPAHSSAPGPPGAT